MVLSRKHRQVPVEYLYYELGNVCGLPFLLLGLFDQQGQHSIERFEQCSGVEYYCFGALLPALFLLFNFTAISVVFSVLDLDGGDLFYLHLLGQSIHNN